MPNICKNDLTVTGKVDEIRKFLEFAKGTNQESELDFNRFIPYPEEYKKKDEARDKWIREHNGIWSSDCPADGFNSGGYEWCCKNWGQKWNAYDIHVEPLRERGDAEGGITMHFSSAWSPPEPVVLKMAEMFPDLVFDLQYSEPMMGLYGHRVFSGNTIIIGNFCDRCEKQEECKKEIYTAILTLMRTVPEKWPKSPRCRGGCPMEPMCALIDGGNSCIITGCWSRRIEPFEEFVVTKGESLKPIQTTKKDLKRYRRIALKT